MGCRTTNSFDRLRFMQTYASLSKLALICAQQARFTKDREVAGELWRMALEYQRRAAAADSGVLPDIGASPSWLKS
jgi:hypothetical protein